MFLRKLFFGGLASCGRRWQCQGGMEVHLAFVGFDCRIHCFTLSRGLDLILFHHALGYRRYTLLDGK